MTVPLTLANLNTAPTADEWNTAELDLAKIFGLPTTAWQQGQIERTILAIVANIQQQSDIAASIMVQAGFLTFAATGFVTYTDASGATITLYVTPDPTIPAQNPTGALGWLDVLADSLYNVQRILATFAGGTLAIVNTSGATYGPFAVGTYHVAQPGAPGTPGYTNTASLTIPPTAVVGTGISSINSSAGLIEVTTTANHGLSTGDLVMVAGAVGITQLVSPYKVWTITVTAPSVFTLDGSAFSGSWTGTGNVYAPQLAGFTADAAGSGSSAISANLVTQPVTSLIGVNVTNTGAWIGDNTETNIALANRCRLKLGALGIGGAANAYVYFAITAQQIAPTLTPPLKLSAAITRARTDLDAVANVVYLTIANAAGAVTGTYTDDTTDVGVVQTVVATSIGVPGLTLQTRSAAASAVAVVTNIFLPAAFATATNKTYFTNALTAYFSSLPIGGVTDPAGTTPNTNVVPYNAVVGSVFDAALLAGIPIQNVDLTLNGGTSNIQLNLSPVPEVAVPTFTVVLTQV